MANTQNGQMLIRAHRLELSQYRECGTTAVIPGDHPTCPAIGTDPLANENDRKAK